MTLWESIRPHKSNSRTHIRAEAMLGAASRRDAIRQWALVGVVGAGLGVYTLIAASLPQQWALLGLLVVLFPLVAMIAGGMRRLLLGIIIIEIPLQIDVYLRYREEPAALGAVGGVNLSLTTLCLAVLYAMWLAELLAKQARPPNLLVRMSLPFVAYLGVVIASTAVARDSGLAGFEVFLLLQALLLYAYVLNAVRSREDVMFVVTVLIIGLILDSLGMIGVWLVGHDISVGSITLRIDAHSRVSGTFAGTNAAASYLTLLLTPVVSVLLAPVRPGYKWLAALAFGLGSVALVLTLSRGGWIAFLLSIGILCLLAWRRGWFSSSLLIIVIIVALILFLSLKDIIFLRLLEDDAGSAESRIPLMYLALRMIQDKPVLGVGANNFAIMIERYATPEFGGEWLYTVHNQYLLVWAETGIVGLVAFLWLLFATLRRGWLGWKLNDRLLSLLALGFTAAILGDMAHMFVDFFNQRPQVQLLWLVAGLIAAIHMMGENTGNADGASLSGHDPALHGGG